MGGRLSSTAKRIQKNAEKRRPLATKKHASKEHREALRREREEKKALALQYRPPGSEEDARDRLLELSLKPLRVSHAEAHNIIDEASRHARRGEVITSWAGKWT